MSKSVMVALTSVLIAMLSQSAFAQKAHDAKKVRPTYTYGGVKYINQHIDDISCSQDGLSVEGSYDFGSPWFARGSFTDASGSRCGASTLRVGGGYKVAWGQASHIYGLLSYQRISPDLGDGDGGLVLGGGMRGYVLPAIEAYVELEHTTNVDGQTNLTAGSAYWFNRQWAVTADVTVGSEQTAFTLGARMAL